MTFMIPPVLEMPFPVIEVHISNLGTRDAIHQDSILTPAVRGTVMGLGWHSYTAALRGFETFVLGSPLSAAATYTCMT